MGLSARSVALAAGAAGAGALLWWLLRGGSPEDYGEPTLEQFRTLLGRLVRAQRGVNIELKEMGRRVAAEGLTIERCAELVDAGTPGDPLAALGVTPERFDALLTRFREDQEVQKHISELMLPPALDPSAAPIDVPLIIEIHRDMVGVIQDAVAWLADHPRSVDTAHHIVQVWSTAQFIQRFGVDPARLEASIVHHAHALGKNREWKEINMKINQILQNN